MPLRSLSRVTSPFAAPIDYNPVVASRHSSMQKIIKYNLVLAVAARVSRWLIS